MAIRDFRLKIKNSDIVNRPLPSQLYAGEPIVNTADGILYFSGITTSTAEWTPAGTGTTANFFEVGSNLYDLRLRNQITEYQGVSGGGLVGKYLKGTASGFVLDDITNITTDDSYVTGATFTSGSNLLTLDLNGGKPSVTTNINITSATGLTLNHNTQLTNLQGGSAGEYYHTTKLIYDGLTGATNPSTSNPFATIADIAAASGDTQQVKVSANDSTPGYLEDKLSGGTSITLTTVNDGGNEFILIDTTHTVDTNNYVTGGTVSVPATNNSNSANIGLYYSGGLLTPHTLPFEDTFVSGGTLNGNNLLLTRNDGVTLSGIDLSSLSTVDTYVTGFTWTEGTNTLSLKQNQGQSDLDVTIDSFTGPITVNGDFTVTGGTVTACDILPTNTWNVNGGCDIGAVGSRFLNVYTRYLKLGTSTTILGDDGSNFEMSGNTGDFIFKPANDATFHSNILPATDLGYNLGSVGQRWNTVYAGDISATGLTLGFPSGRVVYTDGSGGLTTEAGFEYNDTLNRITVGNLAVNNASGTTSSIGQGGLIIGSGGAPGGNSGIGDLTVHGNLVVYGTETIIDTTNLYVEDNNVTLNYNPTGDTSGTYLGAGWTIQDGDGAGTDVTLSTGQLYLNGNINSNSEYIAATGAANLGFFTSLNDILIRNTNNNSGAPDGKRVLAEDDCLDGGTY